MTARWLMLLDRGLDAAAYEARHARGLEPDRLPYGAEHISADSVRFGAPTSGDRFRRVTGRIGFDLVHAWRNRRAISTADVVHSHTEQQYLGAAFVLLVLRRKRVTLVGQTIWFYEDTSIAGRVRRVIFRPLLNRVDLFVYNAWPNFVSGSSAVPGGQHRYIPFGVSRAFQSAAPADARERLIVSVGNDRSRDWPALGAAARTIDAALRVATGVPPAGIDPGAVRATAGFDELVDLYRNAAVVVVPTVDNLHASGITSILEAAAVGTPIVASRTGGIDRYFSDDEISFVPAGDPLALASALSVVLDGRGSGDTAARLRARCSSSGYTNDVYWARVEEAVDALSE
jgi:glycosyltransferase involved in cell wall biosynthesis